MDFWARLVAGTALASSGSKANANNPEKRLARFKREYNQLLQTWRNTPNISKDPEAAENLRASLQELTAIINDETRRPIPHPCIVFASSKQIYIPISKIAATSYNRSIIREGVALFSALLDEEEGFVENNVFAQSLMGLLVRITGQNSIRLSQETEADVVELAFNITTKIRLDPDILPAWFSAHSRDEDEEEENDAHNKFTGKTQKEDFPLFYLLIDYIHEEGRIGDFARTGLLYIIEAASNSVALEQWIVESDLATLMATGLGALYSQLSRKLVIDFPPDELPPILALSDYSHPITTMEIVSSTSDEFQGHMETFLSHLVFWQDVLNHCKSVEVKQTLLDHFQVIFLQQLLYPSLLESSDIDGGSSVAVLTYLRRILESLDHPDMIHLILHYLLALPDTTPATPSTAKASVSAARKRKSMDLASMMASRMEMSTTPDLFNLVDLIIVSLQSPSHQTISATLQLVSAILKRHHRYAVSTLLRTQQILTSEPQRPIGAHEKEMEYLLDLASSVATDDVEEAYDNYIRDGMTTLESHSCSISLLIPKAVSGASKLPITQATIPGAPRDVRAHTLRDEDPMLKALLGILETFFTNPVETNANLTATIIDLATCGHMHVDGWLLPDLAKCVYEEDEEADSYQFIAGPDDPVEMQEKAQAWALKKAARPLLLNKTPLPPLLVQLATLVDQVAAYRAAIPQFDDLLQHRRGAFQAASSGVQSMFPSHTPRSNVESPSRSVSPSRRTFDTLAQRLFPGTPSRSDTPRGRNSQDQPRKGFVTPSGRSVLSPPQFPIRFESPVRDSSRTFSNSSQHSVAGSLDGHDTSANHAANLVAVDQSILLRKIGIPTLQNDNKPIPFPSLEDKVPAPSGAGDGADNSAQEAAETGPTPASEETKEEKEVAEAEKKLVSVSHVLTNVVILQEFLLELAALVQVRAGLLGEVKFV
ncbi:Retinoic acid induced 16-like protein-domain-containing protein [Xylogone sp. PMI_703]|nr:Retinoic acid induced 16-like protein-domain-containing protein [Xylogone sp. PMI_703]